ncbi:hypothetical protein K523DRAFT_65982 [Schizophyllum commune Tattone D]|nr:hypothetical protein K523DRAFT_65982 [Schizophyllum commune Tattone D]
MYREILQFLHLDDENSDPWVIDTLRWSNAYVLMLCAMSCVSPSTAGRSSAAQKARRRRRMTRLPCSNPAVISFCYIAFLVLS